MIWNIEVFNGYNKSNMLKINTKKESNRRDWISTIHTRLGVAIAFSMCPQRYLAQPLSTTVSIFIFLIHW
jgi:hypothetical protein